MALARTLLARTQLPVGEVASRCGYQDQGAFAERFLAETGLTPSLWRQQNGRLPLTVGSLPKTIPGHSRHAEAHARYEQRGAKMQTISWQDFEMVELRVGTLVRVEPFPEARRPAYKVWADFGPELGVRKSSAQITDLQRGSIGGLDLGDVNFGGLGGIGGMLGDP